MQLSCAKPRPPAAVALAAHGRCTSTTWRPTAASAAVLIDRCDNVSRFTRWAPVLSTHQSVSPSIATPVGVFIPINATHALAVHIQHLNALIEAIHKAYTTGRQSCNVPWTVELADLRSFLADGLHQTEPT